MSECGESKLLCYNRGCGQSFDPSTNTPESCVYHPGTPVFHDAYKKWSCCEKKTTDFTEFLNIKGCTKSYHSNVKPVEIPKPAVEKNDKDEVFTPPPQPLKPRDISQRPDENLPMKKLKSKVCSSLKSVLENLQNVIINDESSENSEVVAPDTPCKNNGCRTMYKGEHTNSETCLYHPGYPVFHEGMKYWTCCAKRTTDFNSFLEQIGCTTGNHVWHKPKNQTQVNCRYDWHQTGNSVVISIYAKCSLPELSFVEANPTKLNLKIVFGQERNVWSKELNLFGVIDVECSSVDFLGSKVEVKMKKAEPISWTSLTFTEVKKSHCSAAENAQDINVNDL